MNDIDIDVRLDDYGYTDALNVPKAPTNPWKWITLGRRAFSAPQTTEMVLTHELVHARQYQNQWAARERSSEKPKPGWVAWLRRRGKGFGQGPAELEAEVEVLGHLARLPAQDRDQQLIRAFSALLRTVAFRPPTGRRLPLSPRDAAAAISAVYDKGTAGLRAAIRRQLWRAVLEVSVTRQQLAAGLRLVRRIAIAGFKQLPPALKRSFLDIPGVRDGLVRATTRRPAQRALRTGKSLQMA